MQIPVLFSDFHGWDWVSSSRKRSEGNVFERSNQRNFDCLMGWIWRIELPKAGEAKGRVKFKRIDQWSILCSAC